MNTDHIPLLQRREGAVLVLSNNNPAARNALSPGFYAALTAALSDAVADPTVGAIVLTGEGGHFCSGGDLRQLAQRRELPSRSAAPSSKACTISSAPCAIAPSR